MGLGPLKTLYPGILEPEHKYQGEILVITGGRNVGKTTWCQRAVEQFMVKGRKIGGLLSPGRFCGEEKTGYSAVNLMNGESRLFASNIPGEVKGFQFGRWVFDEQVMVWGNQSIQEAGPVDLLVIDELGFLEFNLKIGWMASFSNLRAKKYRLALVVIRPECIDLFSEMGFKFHIFQLDKNSA